MIVVGLDPKCILRITKRVKTDTYDAKYNGDHKNDAIWVQSDEYFKVSARSHYQSYDHYDDTCPAVTELSPVWLKTYLLLFVSERFSKR